MTKRVELLAPAGNKEAFLGAIHAGADAVYVGGNRFGARAYAENFTEEELVWCIHYAHLWGRKLYLTVNTLVKESELSLLKEYLFPYVEAGVDGVIIQDIGVFCYIRDCFPKLSLHVSTQMAITGAYGAELLKSMGAERIVPARELSLSEIRRIKEKTGLEIECFVHGAMCYCYSGQCLFSSILGGRSGNRGRCAQPCRLPYKVEKGPELYPLSLKDMCTIEHIPELIEAGIDSFKIEGRMKKPEYAAGVTAIYRKYIDLYEENPNKKFAVSKEDLDKLSSIYIRSERQEGYYHKGNGKEMITLKDPSYSKSDTELLTEIRENYILSKPKMNLTMQGKFLIGQPAELTVNVGTETVTVYGEKVLKAEKQPVTRENIEKQLGKLGDSCFALAALTLDCDDGLFMSLKALNELRREGIAAIEQRLIAHTKRENPAEVTTEKSIEVKNNSVTVIVKSEKYLSTEEKSSLGLHVCVKAREQLVEVSSFKESISRIYIDADLIIADKELQQLSRELCDKVELILALPYVLRAKNESFMEEMLAFLQSNQGIFQGFLVRSLEELGYLLKNGFSGKIFGDANIYHWNTFTINAWDGILDGFCLPYELREKEQYPLLESKTSCEKLIYGRIPMMITANCIHKTTAQGCCPAKEQILTLTDRYRKNFPVAIECSHCLNILYNSVPLSLHNQLEKWHNKVNMRIDFTVESGNETKQIMEFFLGRISTCGASKTKRCEEPPYKDYTTGHEKRGVE